MSQYEYTDQYEREKSDFYIDEPFCSEALFKKIGFTGSIHDPACGSGNIIRAAWNAGYKTSAADIEPRVGLAHFLKDYLTDNLIYDNIVCNPPFNLVREFIDHAIKHTKNKVVILARLAFLEGQDRYRTLYSQTPPSLVLVFSRRPSMPPPGTPVGGGKTAYCWLIWNQETKGYKPRLDWLI